MMSGVYGDGHPASLYAASGHTPPLDMHVPPPPCAQKPQPCALALRCMSLSHITPSHLLTSSTVSIWPLTTADACKHTAFWGTGRLARKTLPRTTRVGLRTCNVAGWEAGARRAQARAASWRRRASSRAGAALGDGWRGGLGCTEGAAQRRQRHHHPRQAPQQQPPATAARQVRRRAPEWET